MLGQLHPGYGLQFFPQTLQSIEQVINPNHRRGVITWAEMETPNAARRGQVSWAEIEVPNVARRGQISWAEMEAPNVARRGIVTFAELEVPNLPAAAIPGKLTDGVGMTHASRHV